MCSGTRRQWTPSVRRARCPPGPRCAARSGRSGPDRFDVALTPVRSGRAAWLLLRSGARVRVGFGGGPERAPPHPRRAGAPVRGRLLAPLRAPRRRARAAHRGAPGGWWWTLRRGPRPSGGSSPRGGFPDARWWRSTSAADGPPSAGHPSTAPSSPGCSPPGERRSSWWAARRTGQERRTSPAPFPRAPPSTAPAAPVGGDTARARAGLRRGGHRLGALTRRRGAGAPHGAALRAERPGIDSPRSARAARHPAAALPALQPRRQGALPRRSPPLHARHHAGPGHGRAGGARAHPDRGHGSLIDCSAPNHCSAIRPYAGCEGWSPSGRFSTPPSMASVIPPTQVMR